MNFADEETRLEFHKANTYMQLLSHAFESLCFSYAIQVELMELVDEYSVLLVAKLGEEASDAILEKFNTLYGRTDEDSLYLINPEEGIWLLHGDNGKSLKNLI